MSNSTSKTHSEIVVVGGGPCGSFAAQTAAEFGGSVTVVEEHSHVGIPDHCAGHVSIQGLEKLGAIPPPHIIENEIKRATFYSPSGRRLIIECDRPQLYVLNRPLFDQFLAERARNKGVRFLLGCSADSFYEESGVIKGVKTNSGMMDAEVVIDAEGSKCALLKRSNMPGLDRNSVVTGVQTDVENVEGVEADGVEIYLGTGYAREFFAWIVPRKDGSAKVGLGASRGNPRLLLDRFIERHPIASKKINAKPRDYSFHPIPLCGPKNRTYHDGLLLVGDAASQVKPTTGGGVVFGMMCARQAGKVAARSVLAKDATEGFLSAYERLWKAELSRDFIVARTARWLFNRMSDRAIDRVFRVGELLNVGDLFGDIGEIDFITEILSHTARRPRGLAAILGALLSSVFP
ncbi:MAG: NAD(P)/FAD-dependent oxidoreductase [archaeon]